MPAHDAQHGLIGATILIETAALRLAVDPAPPLGLRLSVHAGEGRDVRPRPLATLEWGRLHVIDGESPDGMRGPNGPVRTLDLTPSSVERDDEGAVILSGEIDDATLGHCRFSVGLRVVAPRQIAVAYEVTPERRCWLASFHGPGLRVDPDVLAAKDDALFPGLEWLLGTEESSATTNAAATFAARSAPHPYKVAVPVMALSSGGAAIGLWWDPLQLWCDAHAYPGAFFALPERRQDVDAPDPAHGRVVLFVPPPASRWTAENTTTAHAPYSVPAGARVVVRATLCAGPTPRFAPGAPVRAHGALAVLDEWLDAQGTIPAPPLPRSHREALHLCLQSYTAQSWDPAARGWHHTLVDPWGPRYEPGVAAQLWHAARLALVPEPAACRAVVRAGVERHRSTGEANGLPAPAPHLDLAFAYGGLEEALVATTAALGKSITAQQEDGSWPFESREERQQGLGQEGDSSSGLTGEVTARLLRHARMTGDRSAEAAGLRGMAYLRTQPRPEGAQTWELQVHVPDVLAAAHGVAAAVEAYRLTGDTAFMQEGERWALAGLPFVYLWNPLFRPIMRYGSLPVFGATYFDIQSWFGVLVQWNGLVYARALLELATLRPATRWRAVAEGIIACAVQQQAPDGPLAGMYPDAYSVIKGDEEYTWWLTPTLLGQPLFALLGQPVEPHTIIAHLPDGRRYHATAADPLSNLTVTDHAVEVTLHGVDTMGCLLLAGLASDCIAGVSANGQALPRVPDLDAVAAGWRCPPESTYLLIKPGQAGSVHVRCVDNAAAFVVRE